MAAEKRLRKPFINTAVKKVAHTLQVLWPRSRTKMFGSNATGLALPTSDVDLVVSLPPVRKVGGNTKALSSLMLHIRDFFSSLCTKTCIVVDNVQLFNSMS